MEIPNSNTLARLAAATVAPEYKAARDTLQVKTSQRARIDEASGSARKRHCERRSRPMNRPTPAIRSATWGPESPRRIGSGGVSSAQKKNSVNQAVDVASNRQAIGIRTSGAQSTSFGIIPGA